MIPSREPWVGPGVREVLRGGLGALESYPEAATHGHEEFA